MVYAMAHTQTKCIRVETIIVNLWFSQKYISFRCWWNGRQKERGRNREKVKSVLDVYICANRLDLRTDTVCRVRNVFFIHLYTLDDGFLCECNAVLYEIYKTYANIHVLYASTRTRTHSIKLVCDSREVTNRNINFYTSVREESVLHFCGKFPYLCIDFNVQHVFIWFQFFNQFVFDWTSLLLSRSLTHSLPCSLVLSLYHSLCFLYTKWTNRITIVCEQFEEKERQRIENVYQKKNILMSKK